MRRRFIAILGVSVALAAVMGVAHGAELGKRELELVLTRNPDLRNGEALYATCAACHGPKGEGVSDGTVPALAGQPYSVLVTQIVAFRAGIRGDPRMVHFTDRSHLAFSQPIADVAGFIARMMPVAREPSANARANAHGAMIYARSCERCHGAVAEGNDETSTPRLASQHYEYLMQQMDDAAAGKRAPMAGAHAGIAKLSRDELSAAARYVAAMAP